MNGPRREREREKESLRVFQGFTQMEHTSISLPPVEFIRRMRTSRVLFPIEYPSNIQISKFGNRNTFASSPNFYLSVKSHPNQQKLLPSCSRFHLFFQIIEKIGPSITEINFCTASRGLRKVLSSSSN